MKITTYYCPSCLDAGSGEQKLVEDCDEDKFGCYWCDNVYYGDEIRKTAKSTEVEIDD